ncbi:MAG: ABC transporter ATP-binding protein [Acidobacteria bacterium]|nr:ABC transporter ATP-binding protein [Acidobacteriota bacterium]
MTEPIIETTELSRSFGDLLAVDQLNLQVMPGEIFGLVGPDGAGKTTTLRILSGLMDPTSGRARVAGFDVTRQVDAVKDQIGYMAQRFALYGDLSVEENMLFYADLFGVSGAEREGLMGQLLHMTRMEPFRARRAAKLSGGMKQKLALMCTLLHHPRILLLDEPTNGVDPVSRRDFWAILYRLVRDGVTIFITTAYLDEAERCHRVGLLHHGSLIHCDAPDALRRNMEEHCYEVVTSEPQRAREFLRACEGVISAEPAGAALHVFFSPAQISESGLRRAMEKAQLGVTTMNRIVPTLEDVFIALIAKAS